MSIDILGPGSAKNAVTTRPSLTTLFGSTRTWFKPCTSQAAQDGTSLTADFFNNLLAQFRTAIDGSGIVGDNADDMLWRIFQVMTSRYAVDTGTTNAIVIANTPPQPAYRAGQIFNVKTLHAPTGAATITIDALTPAAVVRKDGSALIGGEWSAGDVIELVGDDSGHYRLVAAATSSFPRVQVITASGNYVPTPGARKALAFVTGGGAGGGANGGSSATIDAGSGGGAGDTEIYLLDLTGVVSVPCTIGAGGIGGSGGASIGTTAGNGGNTTFGSYCTAGGGTGGANSGGANEAGGAGGSGSGGLFSLHGGAGQLPYCAFDVIGPAINQINYQGGQGGVSFWGGSGNQVYAFWNGSSYSYVSGGNTAPWGAGGAGASGASGIAGSPGVIFIVEF